MKKIKCFIGLSLFYSLINAQELSDIEVESDSLNYEEWNEHYEILIKSLLLVFLV